MYVEFGILNLKLLIPVLYPIFYQIRRFIHDDDEKPIFAFFTNYIGYLCGGIVYLIVYCRMKKNRRSIYDENKNENNHDLNDKDNDKGINSKNQKNKQTIKIESVKALGLGNPSIQDEGKNDFKTFILKKYGFISLLVCILFLYF